MPGTRNVSQRRHWHLSDSGGGTSLTELTAAIHHLMASVAPRPGSEHD